MYFHLFIIQFQTFIKSKRFTRNSPLSMGIWENSCFKKKRSSKYHFINFFLKATIFPFNLKVFIVSPCELFFRMEIPLIKKESFSRKVWIFNKRFERVLMKELYLLNTIINKLFQNSLIYLIYK